MGTVVKYSLAADHLVLVVLASKLDKGGLDDTTTEAEHEVKGRLLLDVVIRESAAILKLLAREDETLLIRGDACESASEREKNERESVKMNDVYFASRARSCL